MLSSDMKNNTQILVFISATYFVLNALTVRFVGWGLIAESVREVRNF